MRSTRSALFFLFIAAFGSLALAQQPAAQPTPVEIKLEAAKFDPYVGQYENPTELPGIKISFFREGDKFYARVSNQDRVEIFASAETKFFLRARPADAEFLRDAAGNVTGMIWRQGGTAYNTKKIANAPEPDTRVKYTRTEAMIPMRDGTKLYTVIFTPETQTENLPIMMQRTPYSVERSTPYRWGEMSSMGYIFVHQDIRGRHKSEGVFEMLRPPRTDKSDPKSFDESTDTYDTIEYLLKNVPKNNGRVGIAGVSYDGWTAAVALLDPHPALKASSPQAPVTDLWMGDDFMHHGAFRQTYAYEWAVPLESAKSGGGITFDKPDMYEWYLPLNKLTTLAPELAQKSHSWKAFLEHPSWDSYWQARATNRYLTDTSVPTLIVGGWWDQEDLYGPLAMYKTLEKTDKDDQVHLVMGPWNHGGWGGGPGRKLGAIDFEIDAGRIFRTEIQAPFFNYHLKGQGTPKTPEAYIFRSGTNKWMSYDSWAPKDAQKRELYLNEGGKLSFEKPKANGDAFDTYVADPKDPVPYRKRPVLATYTQGSSWFTWLVDDQRHLEGRKDVVSWQSDVLTEDLTVTGDIAAKLFASTTGSDSDWVVKLIDAYPTEYPADPKMAGYQLMVADEIFRGRYRKSFEKAEALEPNKVLDYTIDLRGNDYTFKKGHRIVVQIHSSWFPLYDRNPQKFVPNIFKATEADFQTATQRIYRSSKYPTHISVSVAR
jgi:putative CocE/NonD family hydrolase